jgi:hypothetical protein
MSPTNRIRRRIRFLPAIYPKRYKIAAHLAHAQEWPFGESPVDFLHQREVYG